MEQPRPLPRGAIEVIDSKSNVRLKIACMSCIRGHRTTSCGKYSCRSKVFWTLKRPGRPTSACTCPQLGKGHCQCNIATGGCPHRVKGGGESRSVDCRCDEEGRRCCIIEQQHWDALMMRVTPKIDFYESPEELSLARMPPPDPSLSSTPSFPAGTPQAPSSLPSTPGPTTGMQPVNTGVSPLSSYSTAPYETPRFGFMGVGSPLGSEGYVGHDALQWQGQAPQAPQAPIPSNPAMPQPQPGVFPIQNFPTDVQPLGLPQLNAGQQQYQHFDFTPINQTLHDLGMQPQIAPLEATPAQLLSDQWMEDYYNYQFPSAICQNCGLHGCNCRSCPAVMQNSMDGSWATCCSRKHVRNAEVAALGVDQSSIALEHQDMLQPQAQAASFIAPQGQTYEAIAGLKPGGDQPFSPSFNPNDAGLQSGADLNFNDFLMTDPDLPSHGCCCGGDT